VTTFGHEQFEARELLQYTSPWNTNSERIVEGEDSAHHSYQAIDSTPSLQSAKLTFLSSEFICGFDLAVLP